MHIMFGGFLFAQKNLIDGFFGLSCLSLSESDFNHLFYLLLACYKSFFILYYIMKNA